MVALRSVPRKRMACGGAGQLEVRRVGLVRALELAEQAVRAIERWLSGEGELRRQPRERR
jgi:hypothetical protein